MHQAVKASKKMKEHVSAMFHKPPEEQRVNKQVANIMLTSVKVAMGDGGARGSIERLRSSAKHTGKPLINDEVRGVIRATKIRNGALLLRYLEAKGIAAPEGYSEQISALKTYADDGGDGVGKGKISKLAYLEDDDVLVVGGGRSRTCY